jgi:hypothetical protein
MAGVAVWEGVKLGIVIWPIPNRDGADSGLPIYIVVPALLDPLIVTAVAILLMSKPRERKRETNETLRGSESSIAGKPSRTAQASRR